jgi:ABC-type multidrug transport system fused ATPase/permease subunit
VSVEPEAESTPEAATEVDSIAAAPTVSPPPEGSAIQLVKPYVVMQWKRLSLMSFVAAAGGFAEAVMLVLIARIAFELSGGHHRVTFDLGPLGSVTAALWLVIGVAALLVPVRMSLQYLQGRIGVRVIQTVQNRVRKSMIVDYLNAPWSLQSTQREGRLQELLTTYTGAAAGALSAVVQIAASGFSLVALLVSALAVNAYASIGAAIAALAIGVMLKPLRSAVRRRMQRSAQANLEFATATTEFASNLQEVRIFGVENAVRDRIDSIIDEATRLSQRTGYMSTLIPVLYQGTAMLLIIGALALAYAAGFSGLATIGAVALIMIRSLSYAQAVQSSVQGLYEAAPYLQTFVEEKAVFHAAALQRVGEPVARIGAIAFEDVSFAYEPGNPALRDVSFTVERGEIIGIVGPSGAGKSTLVQLLLRLRDPTRGRILSDGRDIRDLDLDDWFRQVTFVAQEARLFAGTVADNIRFFRSAVGQDEIERAARLAHLHDDIVSWKSGYGTPVGERGGAISGGQRQRVCIARALLGDPSLVVFDEPTSALDVRSEALMRETMASLAPERTVFVVAHRLSTLSICDRILVVLNGCLQGFDEPTALELSNPFYREALALSGMRS